MFEQRPDLTFGEVKSLLESRATSDAVTGRTPNPRWGYGRLDLAAVKAILGKK